MRELLGFIVLGGIGMTIKNHPDIAMPFAYVAAVGAAGWCCYRGILALSRWSDARSKQAPTSPEDSPDPVEEKPKGPWGPPAPVQPADYPSGDTVSPLTAAPAIQTAITIDDPPQERPAPALPVAMAPPVPVTVEIPALLHWARMCWVLFWIVLVFPFVRYGIPVLTGSWETLSEAPGEIIDRAFAGIAGTSPLYQLLLLACALGFIICQVKARKALPEAARPTLLKARLILLLVGAIGTSVAVYQIAFIADEVWGRGGVVIPEDDYSFDQTVLAYAARGILFNDFDQQLDRVLNNNDVERARILLEAADATGRYVSPATQQRYERQADP